MRLACLIVGFLSCFQYHCQWRENTSPSYPELISYLQKIDKEHKEIKLFDMGDSLASIAAWFAKDVS